MAAGMGQWRSMCRQKPACPGFKAASLPTAKMLQQETTGLTVGAMAVESGNAGCSPTLSVMSNSLNLANPWATHPI